MAATLLYLNIDFTGTSTVGESSAANYVDQIEVESFNWGLTAEHKEDMKSRKVNTSVTPECMTIEKYFDKSTTVLTRYMKERKAFKKAILHFAEPTLSLEADAPPKKVLTVTLENGYVEDIRLSTSASSKALSVRETVALGYQKLKMEYHPRVIEKDTRGAACTFVTEQPTAQS